jgi:hypothetical protein
MPVKGLSFFTGEQQMHISKEHRELLKSIGLKEEDFRLFDGETVSYEFDPEKGVRLYDPDYTTSYQEYIDIEGWSSWSNEQDTFMNDIVKPAQEVARQREAISPKPDDEELSESLKKKFDR